MMAYVLIPESADRARIESTLRKLAEHVCGDHPSASAICVLGYTSRGQREELGENAPWALVWSPDGLGWNGTSQDDFRQHIRCSAAE